MRFLRTNTAIRLTVGPFFDKTDGITPETALTVTNCKLTFMVDDGNVPTLVLDTNPTASGGANDMVHVTGDDAGFYDLELAAANVNYLGRAMLALTDAANHCPVFHEFMILPAVVYDSMVLGTDLFDVSVTQFAGSAITSSSGIPEVKVASVAANAITATAINADAITAAKIADGAIDRATFAADTGLVSIRANTAQAGAAGTITLDASASASNDFYKSTWVFLTGGTGAGQAREIASYVGSTKVATIKPNWVTNPDNTSTFAILPAAVLDANVTQFGGTDGSFLLGLPEVNLTRINGSSASNAIAQLGVNVVTAGGNTWGSGAITAAVLAPDAITAAKIADGAIDRATFAVDTGLRSFRSNTAQSGASGSITLDASASPTADFYKGAWIVLTGGAGIGQARLCTAYDGATKVATVSQNWATNPDNTTTFAIMPAASIGSVEGNVTGSIGSLATQAKADVNAEADTALSDYGALKPTTAGRTLDVTATGEAGIDWSNIGAPTTTVNLSGTTVKAVTDAPSDSSGVTTLLSRLTSTRAGYLDNLSAGAVATAAKLLKYFQLLLRKDAAIATDNATELTAINADGGSGAGAFANTTDATEAIRDNMGTAQTGDAYARLGAPAGASVSADIAAVKVDTAAIKAKTDNLPSDPADESLVIAATDAIMTRLGSPAGASVSADIAALPTAAENADAVWEEAIADHDGTSGSTAEALSNAGAAGTPPTAADIADAVWEEPIGDHSGTSGSTAEQLAAAGAAGDPWATPLPGSYSAGQAGKIVGDALDATVSSRATPSDVPTANQNADALLDRANAIETGLTLRGAQRLQAAALAGKASGLNSTTAVYRNAVADSKDRITATVTADGNRTAVSTDVS